MSESDPVSLRDADASDAEPVARLVATLATELAERTPLTPAYAAGYLRSPGAHVLLAVRGRRVLGLASCAFRPSLYHAADSCLLDELVVDAAARNQGVGARLLEAVLQRAREHGCVEVSLGVMSENEGARRFYERHGFEADALYMEQHLGPPEGDAPAPGPARPQMAPPAQDSQC